MMEARASTRVGGRPTRVPNYLLQAICDVEDEKKPPRGSKKALKVRHFLFYCILVQVFRFVRLWIFPLANEAEIKRRDDSYSSQLGGDSRQIS
jgi:hypothetical protein